MHFMHLCNGSNYAFLSSKRSLILVSEHFSATSMLVRMLYFNAPAIKTSSCMTAHQKTLQFFSQIHCTCIFRYQKSGILCPAICGQVGHCNRQRRKKKSLKIDIRCDNSAGHVTNIFKHIYTLYVAYRIRQKRRE